MPPLSVVDLPPTEFLTLGIAPSRGATPACWPPVPGPEASYRSCRMGISAAAGADHENQESKVAFQPFTLNKYFVFAMLACEGADVKHPCPHHASRG